MFEPRSHHGSCYLNGYVYVLGGAGLRTAERYRDNVWYHLPKLLRARKCVSVATQKNLIYICDERDHTIETFDTENQNFEIYKFNSKPLNLKMLITHRDSVILMEHKASYNNKGALHTTGMYLSNGSRLELSKFVIHWCNSMSITRRKLFYTCEEGIIWEHDMSMGRSKTIYSFTDFKR
jgi:hypothetical protein